MFKLGPRPWRSFAKEFIEDASASLPERSSKNEKTVQMDFRQSVSQLHHTESGSGVKR